ncbi:LuxR C-terminal-related transcriptional regulator [Dictyobacter aurantiacus]|uniref:DNA-binding response regulator n=1 Tax=Dictyobacter aurantiacus TaxID=1936993 RepID=A0A401ZS77_9CHLR|nr:response regulator transcription factor [Dictyobacter aurantiacus]GCE09656.1 DNA-binding response regulator [Dictyobacter aurantiacus]
MENHKQRKIRLLIASAYDVIVEGLYSIFSGNHEIELVGCATSIPESIRLVGECEPDVLLIDPHMSEMDGLRAIELIRGEWPRVAIVVLTANAHEEHMLRLLRSGVFAYLTSHVKRSQLIHATHAAAQGHTLLHPTILKRLLALMQTPEAAVVARESEPDPARENVELTRREREVLLLVAHGERNKEIAAHLGISEPTVKSHLATIYYKLGVDSRASAVATALERGIITLQGRFS